METRSAGLRRLPPPRVARLSAAILFSCAALCDAQDPSARLIRSAGYAELVTVVSSPRLSRTHTPSELIGHLLAGSRLALHEASDLVRIILDRDDWTDDQLASALRMAVRHLDALPDWHLAATVAARLLDLAGRAPGAHLDVASRAVASILERACRELAAGAATLQGYERAVVLASELAPAVPSAAVAALLLEVARHSADRRVVRAASTGARAVLDRIASTRPPPN